MNLQPIKDFLFGLFFLDLYRETLKLRRDVEKLLEILVFGDLLGVPFLSNYYTLRLLPYAYPVLSEIRKQAVKEREIFDLLGEYHVD